MNESTHEPTSQNGHVLQFNRRRHPAVSNQKNVKNSLNGTKKSGEFI